MEELRPDRALLNPKFDGYKLSGDTLSVNSVALLSPVDEKPLPEDQYSYLYMRIHGMHNHLFLDPWPKGSCNADLGGVYFISKDKQVVGARLKGEVLDTLSEVFIIPKIEDRKGGFNATLAFPTENIAILADGMGGLFLVDTGDRSCKLMWKTKFPNPVFQASYPFHLLASVWQQDGQFLHALLLSVHEKKTDSASYVYVLLEWLQISCDGGAGQGCSVENAYQFRGDSVPYAAWFNLDYSRLILASTKVFHLTEGDSHDPVKVEVSGDIEENNGNGSSWSYTWHQSEDLMSLTFDLPEGATKGDIVCDVFHDSIDIHLVDGTSLLKGVLEKEVEADASRWFIEDSKLQVALVKKQSLEFWHCVVPGNTTGRHDIEGEEKEHLTRVSESLEHVTSESAEENHDSLKHFNMQELEDCDTNLDEEVKLMIVDASTGKTQVQRNLGTNQWLFEKRMDASSPPSICLRHDVDGILWRPDTDVDAAWKHIATFDALGYVQASKQEHKFTTCGRTFKFAAITDCTRNVYLYEQSRSSDRRHNQYIVSLPDSNRILGCQAHDDHLFVLSDKHLHDIRIP